MLTVSDSRGARREAGMHAAIAQLIQSVRAGPADSVRTLSSTDGHLRFLNKLQQRYRQGPSLDAAWENQTRLVGRPSAD